MRARARARLRGEGEGWFAGSGTHLGLVHATREARRCKRKLLEEQQGADGTKIGSQNRMEGLRGSGGGLMVSSVIRSR